VDVELRPVGLCFAFVGNLAFAFGFGGSIGALESADFANVSVVDALQFGSPLALLGFGYLLIRLAPRFGGGSFGVQFLVIGITSLVGALHATDGTERFVGFMIGGTFLATSLFGLLAAGLTLGWRHSLLHAGPVISVREAGGAQPLNVDTFAGAIRLAQKLQGEPQASPAMVTVDMLKPEQCQQILDEAESLRSSGKISDAQYEAVQQWSGLAPKDPGPT
jgi:hypothetical protein